LRVRAGKALEKGQERDLIFRTGALRVYVPLPLNRPG
jgi:hypothetical protein